MSETIELEFEKIAMVRHLVENMDVRNYHFDSFGMQRNFINVATVLLNTTAGMLETLNDLTPLIESFEIALRFENDAVSKDETRNENLRDFIKIVLFILKK